MRFTIAISMIALAVTQGLGPEYAYAGFVNGVETFTGQVKDLTTWEEHLAPAGSIIWNNVLEIDGGGGSSTGPRADITTRSIMVGVGDTVSVEVLSLPTGVSALLLSDDSGGTSEPALLDDSIITMWYNASLSWFEALNSNQFGQLSGTLFGQGTTPPSPGDPYVLRIVRTSSTSAEFTALRSDQSVIGTVTRNFTDIPDDLFISLVSFGDPVTYDNLRAPVPDTAAVPALGVVWLVLLGLVLCAVVWLHAGRQQARKSVLPR